MKPALLILLIVITVTAQDRVIFERRLDDNTWDIFLMNRDGSWQKNLTNSPDIKNIDPAISPDGKNIVFSSSRNPPNGYYALYVMDLASKTVRQITAPFPNLDHSPHWSPDGSRIAFGRCNPDFTICDIFTINADGTGNLTPLANSSQDDDVPRFSPDGSKVLFNSNRDGNYELYVCNVNGSNLQRLTTNTASDGWASWSPDGSKILFSSLRDGSVYELYTMNADGSNVVRLTQSVFNKYSSSFSSDGRRLVWMQRFGNVATFEIVEAALEAMNQTKRLTNNDIDDVSPDYGFVTRKVRR